MADVRYRYKGHYISASKAASLNNLKNASKFISTEYPIGRKSEVTHKGYQPSMEVQLSRAMRKGREEAEQRRAQKARELTPHERKRQAKERIDRRIDESKVLSYARDVAKIAREEDISVEEAMDSLHEADEYAAPFLEDHSDEIESAASGIGEYGEEAYDYDMIDLEREEDRKS